MEKTIQDKILLYLNVYENYGVELINIPPFRITCKEHKILVNDCKKFFREEEHKNMKRIEYYLGIKLEIVTNVEDYC